MKLKTRRILFFASLLIFLVASPVVIMYSLGYKLNTETLKLQKTGGIFVEIDYQDYTVFVNDKIAKEVGKLLFIQRGALMPNLMPRQYKVKIIKEGYLSWEKNIKVESGLVTEVRNIILIPENLKIAEISDNASDFIISSTEEKIGYIEKSKLIILDFKSEEKKNLTIKNIKNPRLIGFSADENIFFENNLSLFKADFETENIISLDKLKNIKYKKIIASRDSDDILYALSDKNNLYEVNFETKTQKEVLEKISNFYITDTDIAYSTIKPANFYKQNTSSEKTTQITFNSIKNININSKIITRFSDPIAIIDEKKNLLLFNYTTETFDKIAENVLDAIVSGDSSKMLFRKQHELYVYYLNASYPGKKSGEVDLIGRFSEAIQDALWLSENNNQIILKMADSVSIIEIDGRDKRNSYKIADEVDKFIYNYKEKSIFLVSDNTLKQIIIIEK